MLYACIQRFDVMDEKFSGEKLNKAWIYENISNYHTSRKMYIKICLH